MSNVKVLPELLRLIRPNTFRACQDSAASAHRRMMWAALRPTALTFPGPKKTKYSFTAGLAGERPMFWFLPLLRIELEPLVLKTSALTTAPPHPSVKRMMNEFPYSSHDAILTEKWSKTVLSSFQSILSFSSIYKNID